MTGPTVIVLSDPDSRDRARAMVGIARRHALVVIVQPIAVAIVVAAVVLAGLAALGLAQ